MNIKQPLIKSTIILVPTYTVAFLTEAMVYTIPMLAVSTIFAQSIFDDNENYQRTDDTLIEKDSVED